MMNEIVSSVAPRARRVGATEKLFVNYGEPILKINPDYILRAVFGMGSLKFVVILSYGSGYIQNNVGGGRSFLFDASKNSS